MPRHNDQDQQAELGQDRTFAEAAGFVRQQTAKLALQVRNSLMVSSTCWSWRSSSIFRQEVGELQRSGAGLALQAHHPD